MTPNASREPSVLHVLPHPGGGGETYVDALMSMEGYRFDRAYLARSAKPVGKRLAILRKVVAVQRAAYSFDLIHSVGEVASTLCLPALAIRPSVISPQGLHLLRRLNGLAAKACAADLRVLVATASKTICAADSEHAEIVSFVGKRLATRALVIHNGVPLPDPVTPERRASLRAEFGIDPSELVGVWLAALDAHKDPLSAIRAVVAVRGNGVRITLLVAGEGPLRAEVEALARGTDGVRVLGFRRDAGDVLAASDFFVLASQREGLSFSLLEAMSYGLVPVVSDAPANVEAVGDAGFVVAFGDIDGFANAFRQLAHGQAAALGERARERVGRRFLVEQMVSRTRDVYDEILGTRRAG